MGAFFSFNLRQQLGLYDETSEAESNRAHGKKSES